jgi:hypothetical protein
MGDESLAEIVFSLFNLDAHLYTVALSQGNAKKDLITSGNLALQHILTQAFSPSN